MSHIFTFTKVVSTYLKFCCHHSNLRTNPVNWLQSRSTKYFSVTYLAFIIWNVSPKVVWKWRLQNNLHCLKCSSICWTSSIHTCKFSRLISSSYQLQFPRLLHLKLKLTPTQGFHSTLPLHASTPRFHSTLPLHASTPRFHSTLPLHASTSRLLQAPTHAPPSSADFKVLIGRFQIPDHYFQVLSYHHPCVHGKGSQQTPCFYNGEEK